MGFVMPEMLFPPHVFTLMPGLGALTAISSRAGAAEFIAGRERKREERNVALRSNAVVPS